MPRRVKREDNWHAHAQNATIFPRIVGKTYIYHKCLNFRTLIGSFLSSIRVGTDTILIYANSHVELSAFKLSTF